MKNKYVRDNVVTFYFFSYVALFAIGLFLSKQYGGFNLWALVVTSAIVAIIATLTALAIDFFFVLLLAVFGKVGISEIYRYMNATGYGTAYLQSYMATKGRNEFRKLIESKENTDEE